jgi:undecaprenyl-diphosphatase
VRSTVLALIAFGGAAQFARIARDVRLKRARRYDARIRKYVRRHEDPRLDVISKALVAETAPATLVPITLGAAIAMRKRGVAAWLPIALAPLLAMTAGKLFTDLMPQQHAPDGSGECCFPSGHTTGVTAETLTAMYVLTREKVFRVDEAAFLCAFPIVAGINRLYRDRHWASDILAGWSAGISVAAICAIVFEQLVATRAPARSSSTRP